MTDFLLIDLRLIDLHLIDLHLIDMHVDQPSSDYIRRGIRLFRDR